MAKYRKLGRTSDQRKALLRNQVTNLIYLWFLSSFPLLLSEPQRPDKALLTSVFLRAVNLIYHGKIITTEARAKEVRKIAEGLIALAVKEKDNFETVKVTAKSFPVLFLSHRPLSLP